MKLFKKITSTLAAIALMSSSFVALQAGAEDVPYLDVYNSQGTWGAGENAIAVIGDRKLVSDDPVMGAYSTITGEFVHICEGSNAVAEKWYNNILADRFTVFEVDFMPDANTQYVSLYTYYTTKLTYAVDLTQLSGVVKVGEWNHLKIVANTGLLAKANNGYNPDRVPSAVWINGTQVLEMSNSLYGNAGITLAKIRERLDAGSSQYIRLRFDAKAGTTTTVGIDNTRIKTADEVDIVNNDLNYNIFRSNVAKNMTPSQSAGLAGRADDDKSYTLTSSAADGYFELQVPSGKKFVKQEFDVLPGEGFDSVVAKSRNQWLTYNMLGMLNNATEANQRVKPNQWNHISLVSEVKSFDLNTGATEVYTEGYVNGILVCGTPRTWTPGEASYLEFSDGAGQGRTYFPFRWGYIPTGASVSYDNFKVSLSNTKPSILAPTLVSDVNDVLIVDPATRYDNAKIGIPDGESITVEDLCLEGGSIRAYEDSTMESELDSDLVLEDGNFVAATDANGIVTYYDVINKNAEVRKETVLDINFDNEDYNGKVGSVNPVKGIYSFAVDGGKADKSLAVTNKDGAADGYIEFEPMDISLPNFVISFNVMPKSDNIKQIFVGSAQSAGISPYFGKTVFVKNQWNKVDLVVKRTTKGSVTGYATAFPVTVTTYINGEEHSTVNLTPKSSGDNKTLLRFIAESVSATEKATVLFDDIKVTQASVELTPDIAMPTPDIDPSVAKVDGNVIAPIDDIMIGDIGASSGEVKVYTDNTYATQKDDSEYLEKGDIVVIADGNKYAYYTVDEYKEPEKYNETLLDINFNNESNIGTTGKVALPKGEFGYGVVGGKADKALSITNPDGATDGFVQFDTIRTDLDYTLIKFNLLPKSGQFSRLYVGTSQHSALTPNLTIGKLNPDMWNSVVLEITNPNPKVIYGVNTEFPVESKLYINGELISTNAFTPKTNVDGECPVRFVTASEGAALKSTCYVDDIVIKQANVATVFDEVDKTMPTVEISDSYGYVENGVIWVKNDTTIGDLAPSAGSVSAYTDATFTTALDDADILAAGNVVVVADGTKYSYYTVDVPTFEIKSAKLYFDGETASKTQLDLGTYEYVVKASNPTASAVTIVPAIAVYDGEGRLVYNALESRTITADSSDEVIVSLELDEDIDGGYIKTFIWDENMRPFDMGKVKVLIIGNSITKHAPSPTIGWNGTWGMAATSEDKDYVHLLAQDMGRTFGNTIEFKCVNIAEFEKYFYDWSKFDLSSYDRYVDFDADVIICSIGANVKNGKNEQDSSYENEHIFTAQNYTDIVNHFNADGEAVVICGKRMLTSVQAVIDAIETSISQNGWASADIGTTTGVTDEEKAIGIANGTFTENVSAGVLGHPGNTGMQQIANALSPLLKTAIESVR